MIVITGAFGFIGSNLTRGVREKYPRDTIVVVDDLSNGKKVLNLSSVPVDIFVSYEQFLDRFERGDFNRARVVLHQGACSDTSVDDGQFIMRINYDFTVRLIDLCQKKRIPLIYASSASVYGKNDAFFENDNNETPLNVYAYSKYMIDQYARQIFREESFSPLIGLRYFNVYGNGENFKGEMASVAFKQIAQFKKTGKIQIFGEGAGYKAGEHLRDFVCVEDVVSVNLFFLSEVINKMRFPKYWNGFAQLNDSQRKSIMKYDNWRLWKIYESSHISESQHQFWESNKIQLEYAFYDWQKWMKFSKGGIYNVGTGHAESFNSLALVLLELLTGKSYSLQEALQVGLIDYVDFPTELEASYQNYTQADISLLRLAGYVNSFKDLRTGILSSFGNKMYP